MKNQKPTVSIILPVFNSSKYLLDTLTSLSQSSIKEIEIIAVCEKSRDDSLEILKKYKKQDKRLRIFSNANKYGLAATLNRGIRHARADFISFADPSGLISPLKIRKQYNFLTENPDVAAVGTQVQVINHKNRKIKKSAFPLLHDEIYKDLISGLSMQFESVMVSKQSLPKDIVYFTQDRYPFVYVKMMLKIAKYKKLANLSGNLATQREKGVPNQIAEIKRRMAFLKLIFKSKAIYDYQPHLPSLLSPFLRSRFYL